MELHNRVHKKSSRLTVDVQDVYPHKVVTKNVDLYKKNFGSTKRNLREKGDSTYGGLVQTIDQYDLLVQEFHVIISEALIHKNPLKIVFF